MLTLSQQFRYLIESPRMAPAAEPSLPETPLFSVRLLWLLIGLGVAWRCVRYFLQFPIWPDEAYVSLNLIHQTYGGLAQPLRFIQVAPYFFLCTELWLYQWLGGSELALRLVAFAAGVGGLLLFIRLAHAMLDASSARLAAGILAVSYFCVQYSAEVKPYSVDLAVAVGLLLLGYRWLREPGAWRWPLVLACFMPVAMGFSYPSVFVAGGIGLTLFIAWLRRPTWRGFLQLVLVGASLIVSFGAFYLLVGKGQFQSAGAEQNPFWGEWFFPWKTPLTWPRWLWDTHAGALMAYPLGQRDGASTLTLVLFIIGVVTMVRRRRGMELTMLLAPFVLTMVASALHKYPYGGNARVAQHLAPAIILLAGLGGVQVLRWMMGRASGASPEARRVVARFAPMAVVGVLVAIGAGGIVRDMVFPSKSVNDLMARRMPIEMSELAPPGTPIVIVGKPDQLMTGLEWYLTRLPNPWIWSSELPAKASALGDRALVLILRRHKTDLSTALQKMGMVDWEVETERIYDMEQKLSHEREYYQHRLVVVRRGYQE